MRCYLEVHLAIDESERDARRGIGELREDSSWIPRISEEVLIVAQRVVATVGFGMGWQSMLPDGQADFQRQCKESDRRDRVVRPGVHGFRGPFLVFSLRILRPTEG